MEYPLDTSGPGSLRHLRPQPKFTAVPVHHPCESGESNGQHFAFGRQRPLYDLGLRICENVGDIFDIRLGWHCPSSVQYLLYGKEHPLSRHLIGDIIGQEPELLGPLDLDAGPSRYRYVQVLPDGPDASLHPFRGPQKRSYPESCLHGLLRGPYVRARGHLDEGYTETIQTICYLPVLLLYLPGRVLLQAHRED